MHVHARMMAISPYIEVDNFTKIKSNRSDLDESDCKFGGYGPFSNWWNNGKCAAIVHKNFLNHALNNDLDAYDFKRWDFHQCGYERWSINFVLMRGIYANKMQILFPNFDDDEVSISKEIPQKLNKHCFALGSAIVVHYSYGPQYDYLLKTNLFARYDELSKMYSK